MDGFMCYLFSEIFVLCEREREKESRKREVKNPPAVPICPLALNSENTLPICNILS